MKHIGKKVEEMYKEDPMGAFEIHIDLFNEVSHDIGMAIRGTTRDEAPFVVAALKGYVDSIEKQFPGAGAMAGLFMAIVGEISTQTDISIPYGTLPGDKEDES